MPDYTRWLNASTDSGEDDLFAGLYTELKNKKHAEKHAGHVLRADHQTLFLSRS